MTLVKRANIQFHGKVNSRTAIFPDGSKKTLGIMFPGDFELGTAEKEIRQILTVDLDVLIPGAPDGNPWQPEKALKCLPSRNSV